MLAFDIDDVIAKSMVLFRGKCDIWFNRPYAHELEVDYDLSKALQCTPSEAEEYVNWCLTCVDEIPIDPYAVKLTEALYNDTGKAIIFVTHRHREPLGEWTYMLIDKWITVPYMIAFAGGSQYQGHNKAMYLPAGYRFVEDRRETAIMLADQGIHVYLIKTPYNTLEPSQKSAMIHPVKDLKEIYDLFY
ncbi:MAG: hypothetical protein ACYTBJ_01025 [Planctomycetota bacterium]|jgi:uncharacterized HAD superfamily protein